MKKNPFEVELIDPLKLVEHRLQAIAADSNSVPFEIRLDPPRNVRLDDLTVAGTYRSAVPIRYDATTRTCYPLRNDR